MRKILQLLFAAQIAEQKKTETLIIRFERLQRLREIAHEEKNIAKIWQCNHLIQSTTKALENRYKIAYYER